MIPGMTAVIVSDWRIDRIWKKHSFKTSLSKMMLVFGYMYNKLTPYVYTCPKAVNQF